MKLSSEMKVGLFALVAVVVVIYMTLRVSDKGTYRAGAYTVFALIDSAEGLGQKTAVEIAGIQVGEVERVDLAGGRKARVRLRISREVKLGRDAVIQVRTKGFLGDSYIDLDPGSLESGVIEPNGEIVGSNPYVDFGQVAGKAIGLTDSVKALVDRLTDVTKENQENIADLINSMAELTSNLSEVVSEKKESLKETMERVRSITQKVDEQTVPAVTGAAEGVKETLGGVNRFQFGIGYHLEYLGGSSEFKNYVGLQLKPRPDKYFLLEVVNDPSPPPRVTETTTTTTIGGVTTTANAVESKIQENTIRISAEIAKTFYNFTFRGGLIESSGGVGIDYALGPLGVQLSAFDFRTNGGQRPHLKTLGQLNVTPNFFVVGGADDLIAKGQRPNWFFGGGLQLIDEDIKSLFGVAALGSASASR